MYTWPENGSSASAVCTIPLSPVKPRRRSVTPAAIQMRVPAGSPIISLSTPAPLAALSRLRNLQFAVFLAEALFPSSPRTTPSRHPSTLSRVSPLLPSLAEVASPSRGLAALGDTVFASRTPGWHSPRVAAPLSPPTHRAPASLPRSLCALECFDAAVSSPRSSEDVVRLCPRFTECGHTQMCPHCPSSSTTLTLYRGSEPDAYQHSTEFAKDRNRGSGPRGRADSRLPLNLSRVQCSG